MRRVLDAAHLGCQLTALEQTLSAACAELRATTSLAHEIAAAEPARAAVSDDPASMVPLDRAKLARQLIQHKRALELQIGGDLFADAPFYMLLDLFASQLEGRRISVSSLTLAANVPQTTALRYVQTLVRRRFVQREGDENDGRRVFVTLTPSTRELVQRWLDSYPASRAV